VRVTPSMHIAVSFDAKVSGNILRTSRNYLTNNVFSPHPEFLFDTFQKKGVTRLFLALVYE
ncbi:MAG: hypothetical protein V1736_02585, partial [Pseudomonadota bacterium]